jgi:FkbM family methyltransferase
MFENFIWPADDQHCKAACLAEFQSTIDAAMKFISQPHQVVQAGGNCGVWPAYLSGLFNYVYTFEPHSDNFRCLKANVTQGNVFMYHAALGFRRGGVHLTAPDKNNAGSYQCSLPGSGTIPVLQIDDLGLTGCDAIFLDVEGMELEALKGGVFTISKFKPVIMFEDRGYREPVGTIEKWLEPHGYEVCARTKRDVICRPRS